MMAKQKEARPTILYRYRGDIYPVGNTAERAVDGFSDDGEYGDVNYPWVTRQQCLDDARAEGCRARFERDGVVTAYNGKVVENES
jgi:hypothetical protein